MGSQEVKKVPGALSAHGILEGNEDRSSKLAKEKH